MNDITYGDWQAWEKERERLIKQIRKGKIKHDNTIVLATLDDEIIITRIDLIPSMSAKSIEFQLEGL